MINILRKVRKTIPFKIALKDLGIDLVKKVKDLYNGNFKILKKKSSRKTIEVGKVSCAHGSEE